MALAPCLPAKPADPHSTRSQTIASQSADPVGARRIVRCDSILSGRWHLEGTTIPIAVIRADAQFGRAELLRQYKFMRLTNAEIDAIVAFAFPPLDEVAIDLSLSSLTLRCVCGEEAYGTAVIVSGRRSHAIACICGRTWRLSVTPELEAGEDDWLSPVLSIDQPR